MNERHHHDETATDAATDTATDAIKSDLEQDGDDPITRREEVELTLMDDQQSGVGEVVGDEMD